MGNVISAELRSVCARILFIYPRETGEKKGQGRWEIKAGKGDAVSKKLGWEDECRLWPFLSFPCWAYWEFISVLPAAIVAAFCFLEQARPKITFCSLYRQLKAGMLGRLTYCMCKNYTCTKNGLVQSWFVAVTCSDQLISSSALSSLSERVIQLLCGNQSCSLSVIM